MRINERTHVIRLKKGKGISKIIYTLIDICQRDQSTFEIFTKFVTK